MIWKVVKVILILALVLVCGRWLFLFYFGTAHVFTFIMLLFGVFHLVDRVLLLVSGRWERSSWRITHYAIFVALLIAEIVARFGIGQYRSYSEENGSASYYSPYRQIWSENFVRRFFFKQEDVGIYIRKPNSKKLVDHGEFSYWHTYNGMGLRTGFLDHQKVTQTIIGMGDSFTEGIGAPIDSTWVSLLGDLMKNEMPELACINAGISGSDVFFELYKLEHWILPKFEPAAVVLTINSSDIRDVIIRGGNERFISKQQVRYNEGPWWESLYAVSFLVRQVVHKIGNVEWHLFKESEYDGLKADAVKRICLALTEDFARLAQLHHFEPIVVFLPLMHELENNERPFEPCIFSIEQSKMLTVIDLFDDFKNLPESQLERYFWQIDRHNTSKGYQFIAESISATLLSDSLLTAGRASIKSAQ